MHVLAFRHAPLEGIGTIADETVDSIYIISAFFTGWMFKAEYFDLLGVED